LDAFRAQRIRSENDFESMEYARKLIPSEALPSKYFQFPGFDPVKILEMLFRQFYQFFRQQGIIPGTKRTKSIFLNVLSCLIRR